MSKIYEAMSAVAEGRIRLTSDHSADVVSSSGTKTYTVEWEDDGKSIMSNDNASFWQGYTGYPIIAVLMVLGNIPYDPDAASHLSGIHWKEINTRFKNDYTRALAHILSSLEEKGVDTKYIEEEAKRIMSQLKALPRAKLPKKKRPPKEKEP